MKPGIRIGEKHSNDFEFDVFIGNSYQLIFQESRSELVDVPQKSGAYKRTNLHRDVVERTLHFTLKNPTMKQLREFKQWISQENVYLVIDQENDVRYFLYKIKKFSSFLYKHTLYQFDVVLLHDPIAEEIQEKSYNLSSTKSIKLDGNVISYPVIEFTANTQEKLIVSFGGQHLIFENGLVGNFKMDTNPYKPSVSVNGKEDAVEWKGDFIEFDPNKEKNVGFTSNPNVENPTVKVRWRWL